MAERMTFHLLKMDKEEVDFFVTAVKEFKEKIKTCSICGLVSEQNPCRICTSSKRNKKIICIVKNVQDAFLLERSGSYNGLYHVLGGLLSPIEGIGESDLTISGLFRRLDNVEELLFALEENIEAKATIESVRRHLTSQSMKISRLAIGIPTGTGLEHIDVDTIKESLLHRIKA